MPAKHLQAEKLFQRKLKGHALYSQVVVAEGTKFVFIAGALSRDKDGNVVGAGDMRAQIRKSRKT
jgi:enamine deaminase RidA (YjgF/YER057c/UK114 family)